MEGLTLHDHIERNEKYPSFYFSSSCYIFSAIEYARDKIGQCSVINPLVGNHGAVFGIRPLFCSAFHTPATSLAKIHRS